MRPISSFSGSQSGFTVLEVVVAVIILALAYVVVLQNFSLSLRNIGRVDAKRQSLFSEMLAFEQLLRGENDDELPEGEVFLEGSRYRLVRIDSEDDHYVTMVMEKI